jgi:hypothetical protein
MSLPISWVLPPIRMDQWRDQPIEEPTDPAVVEPDQDAFAPDRRNLTLPECRQFGEAALRQSSSNSRKSTSKD